jgi:cyclopropane-fatty-acyl-phospholipid synthase
MQYTCAYFSSIDEDLDSAQEAKLAYICRKLRLRPGDRLLDIGCGFGGLAMYAAQKHGVRVLGVTLSRTQADYANEQIARAGLANRVTVALQDYREVRDESFDKIVSVGMFEHVGRSHLPEYFTRTYQLLRAGQVFLNHGISRRASRLWLPGEPGRNGAPPKRASRVSWQAHLARWILAPHSFPQHYVFPDGELAPVSEVNTVAERAGFELRDLENLREHYGLTLRRWVAGLEEHWDEAVRVAGEVTCRTWRLYMAASAFGFESGELNVNQSLLVKSTEGKSNLPLTRDYMRVDAGRS